MKARRKERRGRRRRGEAETYESPRLGWRADFMLSDKRSGPAEETPSACECARPRCVSLRNPECVGVIGSVGLSHWEASNVFVWWGGRISSSQCRAVIPVLTPPFHPTLPAPLQRSSWFCPFCFLFCCTSGCVCCGFQNDCQSALRVNNMTTHPTQQLIMRKFTALLQITPLLS